MNARNTAIAVGLLLLAIAVGWWGRGLLPMADPHAGHVMPGARSECPAGAKPLYWKAPMDPTYVRHFPGKSPMGMDLVPVCPGEGDPGTPGSVILDSATVQRIGLRIARVERRSLSRGIRAMGRVAYDERRVTHVHTKVNGWIERLFVEYVGQHVERGQPLLEIYSPDLVATQEELLLAARYRDTTGQSRFEDVRGAGVALEEATRRRLELWDIRPRDIDRLMRTGEIQKTLTLYAPRSGVVTALGVRTGMEVGPDKNLYTIADLSRVWVVAQVYESELPWLSEGLEGTVEFAYLPEETFAGPVTYIAPFLDPKTRTAEVRLELPNPGGLLRPEMFGTTTIRTQPRPDVVAIPSEALIRSGRRTLVIVARGDGSFDPRAVEVGLDSGDGWIEITRGLEAGEQLVVSSQFLIDSESRLQEAVQKLLGGRPPQGE